jgi:hypothetical protein
MEVFELKMDETELKMAFDIPAVEDCNFVICGDKV